MFNLFKKKVDEGRICPEMGVFAINGQINDNLAYDVINGVLDYSNRYPNKIITLHINSEGGSVKAGMAIYDMMRILQNPIRTIAHENVMGISVLLLAAGTRGMRSVQANTRISLGQFCIREDAKQIPKQLYAVIEKVMNELAVCSGSTVEQVQKILDIENDISIENAVQAGFIDTCNK